MRVVLLGAAGFIGTNLTIELMKKPENEKTLVDKNKDFEYDSGKLVIYSESNVLSGKQIYNILRDKYGLQPEMSLGR